MTRYITGHTGQTSRPKWGCYTLNHYCVNILYPKRWLKPQSHYSDNQSPTNDNRQPSTTNYRPNFRSTIGRRPVADQSPTNCQSLADRTPSEFRIIIKIWKPIGDWLSQNQRLVGNHSAIGRRPFCIRGTKAWQIYAYQPETSVVSLAVQGIIRIANEALTAYYSFVILIILLTAKHA